MELLISAFLEKRIQNYIFLFGIFCNSLRKKRVISFCATSGTKNPNRRICFIFPLVILNPYLVSRNVRLLIISLDLYSFRIFCNILRNFSFFGKQKKNRMFFFPFFSEFVLEFFFGFFLLASIKR